MIDRSSQQAEDFVEDLGNGIIMEMVFIPGGSFMMGSPPSEEGRYNNENPQYRVTVTSFYMGKYPITQAQWRAVAALPPVNCQLNGNPSYFKGTNRPVEQVSWYKAVEFTARLSRKTGRHYRLPSEAEWEYACRAGTTTPFYFGETITPDLANYYDDLSYGSGLKGVSSEQTTDAGSFPPNAFGLYDMHGNVYEWCGDPWHKNYEGAPYDGSVWESDADDSFRMMRGGCWGNYPANCRSAFRIRLSPDDRYRDIGLRVVSR